MIFLNALRGVEARITMGKAGAWFADVDLDLELVPIVPSGRAVLTVGVGILNGTIDERATGRFGTKAMVRLVGGAGWGKPVQAMHLHNDAGVFSTAIYAVVAASVGEPPVIELAAPTRFGVDYALMQGPASQVFRGVDWWVDILGITHVGPRIPLPAPPTIEILEWDPTNKVAVIASDVLILPGTVLIDPIRFGTATVDDVQQTFNESGGRAIAWCSTLSLDDVTTALLGSPPASAGFKLVKALGAHAQQAAGVAKLKKYPYRVVAQGPDGRVNLQYTKKVIGGEAPPFLMLIDIWAGLPGLSVKLTPSSIVLVSFVGGAPIVTGFDPNAPPAIEITIDALRIAFGLGTMPVAKLTPAFLTWLASVGTATGVGPPPPDLASLKVFTE